MLIPAGVQVSRLGGRGEKWCLLALAIKEQGYKLHQTSCHKPCKQEESGTEHVKY